MANKVSRGNSASNAVRELARRRTSQLLSNPDILSRTFRLYNMQNLRSGLWDKYFPLYLDTHYPEGHPNREGRRTTLKRRLWGEKAFTWLSLVEGLLVLKPLFDTLDIVISTDREKVYKWVIPITDETLNVINEIPNVPTLPKSNGAVVPLDYVRPDVEPHYVAILRDLLQYEDVQSKDIRSMVTANFSRLPTERLKNKSSNFRQSIRRGSISWTGLVEAFKGLGMKSISLSIVGQKGSDITTTTQAISLGEK